MKKIIFLLFFYATSFSSFSQGVTLDGLRREYNQVKKDSASCAKLYKKIIKSSNADVSMTAYRGAIIAAMADYPKDKKEKIKLFNTGKKLLEQSVAADTANVEMRFLRYTVQVSSPKALGYNKQLLSDKNYILKNYSSITNIAVKNMISTFLLQYAPLTETEKQKLK